MFDAVAAWLFDPAGLTPHGFCLLWEPWLIWIHALADAGTGLAYFSIPIALAIVARRRADLVFRPLFWLFAAFILLCGTGHWLDLLTLWVPAYGVEGVVKAMTALVSVATAIALWRLLPAALVLPSTEQLRTVNAALRDSVALHRARFEQSPAALYSKDEHGIVTGASDSWLDLLGYTREEVVGRPITDFAAPGDNARAAADLQAVLRDGATRDLERHFIRRDGSIVIGLVSAHLERHDGNNWIVCVLIDITARRQAEAALRASEDRLQQSQKMEAVGQLTGGVAHDFNNMLQAISGGLDLIDLRIDQGRADDAKLFIGMARQSVDNAASLTRRMLAFARRQRLQPGEVAPERLVTGMSEMIRRTVGPAIALRLTIGQGVWGALCDPHQLESALVNLAINARDAMPAGGILTIEVSNRRLTAAALDPSEEVEPGDYIEIAVTDDGTGMSAETAAHAFEPFFTTKPIGQGTGLGLSQIYGFVRQSNGLVRLTSEPGKGTTVAILLPRHVAAITGVPQGDEMPPVIGGKGLDLAGRTVLLVEDEASVRELIKVALTQTGCTVLEAFDGPSGLEHVRSGAPIDLLITDVGLPGFSGRKLAAMARASRAAMPILLITGYAGIVADDGPLDPAIQTMAKPFSLDAICMRVRTLLREPVAA